MLLNFKVRMVGSELVRRKRKLTEVLGVEGGPKYPVPFNRRTQAYMVLVEEKKPELFIYEQAVRVVEGMGSVNTLLPETPRVEARSFREGGRHAVPS